MGVKFKKGVSGNPAGRPKESKNKFRFDVAAILNECGCNPFQILAGIAMNGEKVRDRLDAASELAGFVAPRLKAMEHSVDNESPFKMAFYFGGKDNNDNKS